MNQNELNEINEEYNEAETARTIARQAAYEAYDEYDKGKADKDHADVCFRRLLFSLNETYGGNAIFMVFPCIQESVSWLLSGSSPLRWGRI